MKAVVIRRTGGPDVLEVVDLPMPVPGRGEVLVRAIAIGAGWPDILIRTGKYKWMPPLPASPGSDMAGEIAALGPGVDSFSVGDKVLITARELTQRGGCYAEYLVVPEAAPFRLSPDADLRAAACLPNYQVAWAMLQESVGPRKPSSIFIAGAAGGVGSAVVQLARHLGMTVIGSISSPAKETFARAQGVEVAIDYKCENVLERVLEITEGRGVDLVFDHVGGSGLADRLKMLAPWGTVVSFNAASGLPPSDIFAEMRALLPKSPTLRCFSMHSYDKEPVRRRKLMDDVIGFLEAGAIKPAVGLVLPLASAAEAHMAIERGDVLGKVLLVP